MEDPYLSIIVIHKLKIFENLEAENTPLTSRIHIPNYLPITKLLFPKISFCDPGKIIQANWGSLHWH
jgi:hypothetical protein